MVSGTVALRSPFCGDESERRVDAVEVTLDMSLRSEGMRKNANSESPFYAPGLNRSGEIAGNVRGWIRTENKVVAGEASE